MNDALFATLRPMLHLITGVPPERIHKEDALCDLGLAPVATLELVDLLAEDLGVTVSPEEVAAARDVEGLVTLVHRRLR